jgi:hypothetical protein
MPIRLNYPDKSKPIDFQVDDSEPNLMNHRTKALAKPI